MARKKQGKTEVHIKNISGSNINLNQGNQETKQEVVNQLPKQDTGRQATKEFGGGYNYKEPWIKKHIFGALFTVVILGLFVAYFQTSKPYLSLDLACGTPFGDREVSTLSSTIINNGDVPAFSRVCYFSDELLMNDSSGNFVHELCTNSTEIPPKPTGMYLPLRLTIKSDKNKFDETQNATLRVNIGCEQKIWSLVRKACSPILRYCRYQKDKWGYFEAVSE